MTEKKNSVLSHCFYSSQVSFAKTRNPPLAFPICVLLRPDLSMYLVRSAKHGFTFTLNVESLRMDVGYWKIPAEIQQQREEREEPSDYKNHKAGNEHGSELGPEDYNGASGEVSWRTAV